MLNKASNENLTFETIFKLEKKLKSTCLLVSVKNQFYISLHYSMHTLFVYFLYFLLLLLQVRYDSIKKLVYELERTRLLNIKLLAFIVASHRRIFILVPFSILHYSFSPFAKVRDVLEFLIARILTKHWFNLMEECTVV